MSYELPSGPEVNRRKFLGGLGALLSPIKTPLLPVIEKLTIAQQAAGAGQLITGIFNIMKLGEIFQSANRALPGGINAWGLLDQAAGEQGIERFFTSFLYSDAQLELIRKGVVNREKAALAALDTLLKAVDSFLDNPAIQQALEATKPDCGWIHQRAQQLYRERAESLIDEKRKSSDFNDDMASMLIRNINLLPCPNTHLAFLDTRWEDIPFLFQALQGYSREEIAVAGQHCVEEEHSPIIEDRDPEQRPLISDIIRQDFQKQLDEDIAAVEGRFLSRLGFSEEASCRYRELFTKKGSSLLWFLMGQVSQPFNSPVCFEEWLGDPCEALGLKRFERPLNFLSPPEERTEFRNLVVAGWKRNKQMIKHVVSTTQRESLTGESSLRVQTRHDTRQVKDPFESPNTDAPIRMEESVFNQGTGYVALRLPRSMMAEELDLRPVEFIRDQLLIPGRLNEIKAARAVIASAEAEASFKSLIPIRKPEITEPACCVIRLSPSESFADVTIMDGDDNIITLSLAPEDHLFVLLTETRAVYVTSGTAAECILNNKLFYFSAESEKHGEPEDLAEKAS